VYTVKVNNVDELRQHISRLSGINLASVLQTRRSSSGAPASELASKPKAATLSTNFRLSSP